MVVAGGHAHSFTFWVLCIVRTQILGARCGAVEALLALCERMCYLSPRLESRVTQTGHVERIN
jgi:hypothetical protein